MSTHAAILCECFFRVLASSRVFLPTDYSFREHLVCLNGIEKIDRIEYD